jgi:hypothetical protein
MRLPSLLAIRVVTLTSIFGPEGAVAGPPAPAQVACRECDQVVDRVLRLLPERPDAVVAIDTDRSTPALRQAIEDSEGFSTEGQRTVYLRKQAPLFQRALRGASVWDYALACVVWHEMAHIAGASELEAQRREEELLTQFIVSRKVDATWGLAYSQRLRKRHPEEPHVARGRP